MFADSAGPLRIPGMLGIALPSTIGEFAGLPWLAASVIFFCTAASAASSRAIGTF